MAPQIPPSARPPHPIRDGLGFLAAAFTALVRAFGPPKPPEVEIEEAPGPEAQAAPAHGPLDPLAKAVAKVIPYPAHD